MSSPPSGIPLADRYASLTTRVVPAGEAYERSLTQLEASLFRTVAAAVARGVRGFAVLRIGLRVEGPIDIAALARACDVLVDYHDAMRTTYPICDGVPVARVHSRIPSPVRVVDAVGDDAMLDAVLAGELDRDIDLAAGPIHRFVLVRTGAERLVFAHFAHHIACDGASYMTLFRDLDAIYAELAAGRSPPALRTRRVSYADYAEWQTRTFDEADRTEHRAFWRTQVADGPLPPPIAAIGARLLSETPRRWAAARSTASPELGPAVTAFARARKISAANVLFGTLLALQHAEGAGGVPVGFISSNRRRETLRIIGLFATLIPVRVPSSGDLSFAALLGSTDAALARAFDHQELTYVPEPMPEPPFRVVFNFAAKPDALPRIAGLPTERVFSFEKPRALYDLWLNLELDRDDQLHFRVEYALDLVDDEMRASYVARYAALLKAAITAPDQSLDELAAELSRTEARVR